MRRRESEQTVYDAYTPLTFKRQFRSRGSSVGAGDGFHAPDWVGPIHYRRIQAYAILQGYLDNAAREFMAIQSRDKLDERREYGDAALLVATVVGALLGEDQQIVTEGAEELALETEPDDPNNPGASEPDPEAAQRRAEAESAMELQEWLRRWAKDERLPLKMREAEGKAVGVGDGVYTLGWSPDKKRARLRVWDPMFYFPVLDDGNEDDFPQKVHIAYEVVEDTEDTGKTKIRRITWELGPIGDVESRGLDADLLDNESVEEDGGITRLYPWNEEPSRLTCYLTDATWEIDQARSIEDFTGGTAVYATDAQGEINRRDLELDFIPVVHVPNTVALLDGFGRALITTVAQILDDISSADTDLAASGATTGHPVIALQGGRVDRDENGRARVTYEPGEILESGDGKLDVLDTSNALAALISYIEFLLKRLSVNSRVAEALQGRIKASEVPSGVALALSFGPTDNLVKEMRLVRNEKYPLLLKFAHRIALAGQAAGADIDVPPEWVHSEVTMGNFLPQDQATAVTNVTGLLQAKAISLETGIIMLVEAGFPISSAMDEVRRIQERDFEAANELFDATGDKALVYDFLGKEPPEEPEPAPEQVTVVPGQVPVPPNPGEEFGPDGQPVA